MLNFCSNFSSNLAHETIFQCISLADIRGNDSLFVSARFSNLNVIDASLHLKACFFCCFFCRAELKKLKRHLQPSCFFLLFMFLYILSNEYSVVKLNSNRIMEIINFSELQLVRIYTLSTEMHFD